MIQPWTIGPKKTIGATVVWDGNGYGTPFLNIHNNMGNAQNRHETNSRDGIELLFHCFFLVACVDVRCCKCCDV